MEPGIIYRIQNNKGEGMYHGGAARMVSRDTGIDLYTRAKHPNPSDDELLIANAPHLFEGEYYLDFYAKHYIFGFSDIDQLKRWIVSPKIIKGFHDLGYYIVRMQGEVHHGNTQAVILASSAAVLETILLDTLVDEMPDVSCPARSSIYENISLKSIDMSIIDANINSSTTPI